MCGRRRAQPRMTPMRILTPTLDYSADHAGAFDAPSGVGRGPSRNQIVMVKRLPANASVSQRTGHTSWNMSLGKNTMLLSTGVSVVYVAAAVLPEGVTQLSYTLSSPPVKRRGLALK